MLHAVFSGDDLLFNCKIMDNARVTALDGYSEYRYTGDTCTTLKKTLNCCAVSSLGCSYKLFIFSLSVGLCERKKKNQLFTKS